MTLSLLAILLAGQQKPLFEVPFTRTEDAMFVNAVVNGASVTLLFDTGFSGSVILNSGIEVGKPVGTMTLRDFVANSEANTIKLKSLSLGGRAIEKPNQLIVQRVEKSLSSSYNVSLDGILGLEPFTDYVVELNFQRNVFRFFSKDVDVSQWTADGKKTFLAKLLPFGRDSLELPVELPNGKTLSMALDTGNAFYSTTHRDSLERVGLWPSGQKPKFVRSAGVASGAVDTWLIQLKNLKIFGVPVESSVWDVIDLPSSSADADGTVGFQFLKNFNIVMDYQRRRVWMERITDSVSNSAIGEVGMVAGYSRTQKKVLVAEVSPDSPAALGGIQEGDELISLNGRELEKQSSSQIRKMLEGPLDSVLRLTLSRNGSLVRLQLVRKALFNQLP